MGNEGALRRIAGNIMGSVKGVAPVNVIGIDMEEENESVYDDRVTRASSFLGKVDAFVHCYSYEGKPGGPVKSHQIPM